jgi:hypothetical protein
MIINYFRRLKDENVVYQTNTSIPWTDENLGWCSENTTR